MDGTLIIHTDEDRRIAVTREESPELYAAFEHWQASQRGDSAELHAWNKVIDEAGDYLATIPIHEAAEDVTVS